MPLLIPNTEGLYRVSLPEKQGTRADIVFIHGVGGGARSTWEYGKEDEAGGETLTDYFFWPAALDRDMPECAVWSLGYEAGVIPWFGAPGLPIEDGAVNLMHRLTTGDLGTRPLFFVTHSMGGLMAKEMVVQASSTGRGDKAWEQLVKNIAGIVFCGTPHRGSDVAKAARRLTGLLGLQQHVRDMAAGVRHLDRLHTGFVNWQRETNVPLEAYAERLGMLQKNFLLRLLRWKLVVVPPGSADPQIGGCRCIPCNEHHSGLVKPRNRNHDVYAGVAKFIQNWLKVAAPAGAPPADPLHALPPVPPNFSGRVKELESLRQAQPADGPWLAGLCGMGGIGKTALAIALAQEWKTQFPDAQIFLDGQGLSAAAPSAGDLMARVIQMFDPHLKLPDDPAALTVEYRRILKQRRLLILLDNAKDTAQAARLIPPAGCGLIVTSRTTFILDGRPAVELDSLTKEETAALLHHYAGTPGLTDAEIDELHLRLTGHPLALKLAGAWLAMDAADRGRAGSAARYLKKLRQNPLATIDSGGADSSEDLRTISQSLSLSEALLSTAQRDAWRALGVFPAPFDEAAALAVAGADEDTLKLLVHRSMLDWKQERLKMHDLAAEYARKALGPAALEGLWRKYVSHYTRIMKRADAMYDSSGPAAPEGLLLFDAERAHADASFIWLNGRTDSASREALMELVNAVTHISDVRFHPRQHLLWQEARLSAATTAGNRAVEAGALTNIGTARLDLGEVTRASEYYAQSLAIFQELQDERGQGLALNNIGTAHRKGGELEKAIASFEQSLILRRKTGDRRGESETLNNLGNVYDDLGDKQQAVEKLEESLAISRALGHRQNEGLTLNNLGLVYRELGDSRRAMECYEQGLTIYRETGNRRAEGNTLWNKALLLHDEGDRGQAISLAEEALLIFETFEAPDIETDRRTVEEWKAAARGKAA